MRVLADVGQRKGTCTEARDGVWVELGVEERMEAVDDAAVAHREAQLDQLLRIEVRTQFGEQLIGDRRHAGARLGESDDRRLVRGVDAFGQGIVAKVRDLLVGESDVSTETYVGRNSIMAVVRNGRGEIGQLSLIWADVRSRCRLIPQVQERLEHVGVVRKRTKHVDVPTRSLA